jgi:hypothetical protein
LKETENSKNNGENTQQTYSANAAATNTTDTSSNHTTTQDQLQSVAARSVLEIGYTKEQVLDARRKNNELHDIDLSYYFKTQSKEKTK